MATKPTLSREYLYVPVAGLNVDIGALSTAQLAFMGAGIEPAEIDWLTALVVDDVHPAFDPDIGNAIAILVGPDRGDGVTTETLGAGDFQVWADIAVTGSDERIVRVAGTLTISATGA